MTETTARFGWPLLAPGQAQKELTHNEALALIDLATVPLVEGIAATPPNDPLLGEMWIVGDHPEAAWGGYPAALAGWTTGGWRFVPARRGMAATRRADGAVIRFDGKIWRTPSLLARPFGGAVIDTEARAALGAIIDALATHGLLAGSTD